MNADAHAQTATGLLRLDDFAALRVSGEDRVDFLQGQLSQDMGKVTPSQAAPAAWCNRQGRVLCLTVALDWQDAIFLILPAEMADTCADGLSRYILRAKVQIELWHRLPGLFGCSGLEDLGAEAWAVSGDEDFCAIRLPGAGERALLLGEPPAHIKDGSDSGWTLEDWRLADIRAELPWVGENTSGKFLAHSLNLDLSGAVSFTKGCFVGQEIIARMHYRGTPKRRMQQVQLPAGPAVEAGARVDLPEQGAATVIAWAPSDGNIEALAEVRIARDGK